MKKVCFYTIADDNNLSYAQKCHNSLMKFHPDVPRFIFTGNDLQWTEDPKKFYRMYAVFGERLSKEYDLVIQLDADSIVCGNLNHIINDTSYDIGCVMNNNTIDPKVSLFNIPSDFYVNAGFIAARSPRFWKWWNKLNYTTYFDNFQYVEQDTLNMIVHFGDLRVKMFDMSDKWHGLVSKGLWNKLVMKNDDIVLPEEIGENNIRREEKTIKIIHWAGGHVVKMNVEPFFKPEVVQRLKYLTGGQNE